MWPVAVAAVVKASDTVEARKILLRRWNAEDVDWLRLERHRGFEVVGLAPCDRGAGARDGRKADLRELGEEGVDTVTADGARGAADR